MLAHAQMNWGYDDVLITADRHAFFKARACAQPLHPGCKAKRTHHVMSGDALCSRISARLTH
jgi:hypothetical protein